MEYLTRPQTFKLGRQSRHIVKTVANLTNEDRSRVYLNGMLQRAYRGPKKEIRSEILVQAMLQRWSRVHRVSITTNEQCLAIRIYTEEFNSSFDKPELDLVAEVLNTYGLAFHFVDYIKYDLTVCDPRTQAFYLIDLGVPVTGSRTIEWDLYQFK